MFEDFVVILVKYLGGIDLCFPMSRNRVHGAPILHGRYLQIKQSRGLVLHGGAAPGTALFSFEHWAIECRSTLIQVDWPGGHP